MSELTRVDVVALVDHDLSPLLSRYESLANILHQPSVDLDDVAPFLDDLNVRFTLVLDRLVAVSPVGSSVCEA